MELGGKVSNSLSIRKAVSPYVEELSRELKVTVIGVRRPQHFGMLGMIPMAFLPEEEKERLLNTYPLVRLTEKTNVDKQEFMKRLSEINHKCFCVESGEVMESILGVGAPIGGFEGKAVAAVGLGIPEFLLKGASLDLVI